MSLVLAPLIVLLVLASLTAIVGCPLVARGQSMLPDALTHAALPGVVGAALLSGGQLSDLQVFWGAMLSAGIAVGGLQLLTSRLGLTASAALAVVYPSMLSIGLLWTQLSPLAASSFDTHQVFFGSLDLIFWPELDDAWTSWSGAGAAVATAPPGFLLACAGLAASVVAVLVGGHQLQFWLFDHQHFGLQSRFAGAVELIYLALIAASSIAAFLSVGAILAISLFIAPALGGRAVVSMLHRGGYRAGWGVWMLASLSLAWLGAFGSWAVAVLLPEVLLPSIWPGLSGMALLVPLAGVVALWLTVQTVTLVFALPPVSKTPA